jgi:hypothetical protein
VKKVGSKTLGTVKKAGSIAMAAGKAGAAKLARAACKASVVVLAKAVKLSCKGTLLAAEGTLKIAQKAWDIVHKVFLKAKEWVTKILDKVREMINFLTNFELLTLGFEGGFDDYKVTLKASLRMDGVVKNYAIDINMKTVLQDMIKFVGKLIKKIFQQVVDAVMGTVKSWKDTVMKLKIAAVEAVEEMETELVAVEEEETALLQQQQQNDQEQQEADQQLQQLALSYEAL